MRLSNALLASAVSALAYAAPVAQRDDECAYEPETSSAVSVSSIAVSSAPSVASTSSAASSSVAVTSAAAAIVATSAAVSSSAAATTSAATSTTAVASTRVASSASASETSSGSFQWFGVNESGAEFGTGSIPGTLGTDYIWPNTSAIDILMSTGMNIFRVPILMERIVPTEMTGTIDATYLSGLTTVVNYITDAGASAVIDPHNFGRYSGSIFTSTSDFQTFWTTLATEFKDNSNVIFDCQNEFHDEPSNELVANLNQACIDGVRAAGATSQYIFVEGTSYTGAWTWTSSGNADSMGNLTDSENKIIYEFHQYLDSDGSGTSATCVSSTIGAERVADATTWLQTNSKLGILGEYAGGANTVCETAVTGMLDSMAEASDVWMGALWWAAGPWWADYIYSMEPSSGIAYESYVTILSKYL